MLKFSLNFFINMVHFIDDFAFFTVAPNDTVRFDLIQSDTVTSLPIPKRFTKPLFNSLLPTSPKQDETSTFPFPHDYTLSCYEIYLKNQLNTSKFREVMRWGQAFKAKLYLY